MQSVDRVVSNVEDDAIDHLMIRLRAYVTADPQAAKDKGKKPSRHGDADARRQRVGPSDWVLVFDCETRTTPEQRLRFGAYQLRHKGALWEIGVFYDPGVLGEYELALLCAFMAKVEATFGGVRVCVRTRADFVDEVFYGCGQDVGAQIVGFNLPFDLSRLAVGHVDAQRSMKGGFSLNLADHRPNVAVKHLSQRAALIHFVGLRDQAADLDTDDSEVHQSERRADPDRGFFVDVKTLAAALTSQSHSLESLSALLPVKTKKKPADDYAGPLTPNFIKYSLKDVQSTWECFEHLNEKLNRLELTETGPYDLYSEASLGKAYLRTMNITPWREVQPDFPPHLIGHILSAYYGGRAEVHIRREITPVIHCDFLSMYPTVCTLMGLWHFVRAEGTAFADDTDAVRAMVATPPAQLVEMLRTPQAWPALTALVQVQPDGDLFPVRARYVQGEPATIGLNLLSSDEAQWFTLADVLVSAVLSGKAPRVLRAIRFRPKGPQGGLRTVSVSGRTINPLAADFYRELIIHRTNLKAQRDAAEGEDKAALSSAEKAVKILANATSYGIFVELNPEDYSKRRPMIGYGARDEAFRFKGHVVEKPGRYFHPLLGTLITGAARLMLALAERQVQEQKLDWVFCDTDSIAIAKPPTMDTADFKSRALAVRDWFGDLNPYGLPGSILQLEKVNFPPGEDADPNRLDPPLCLAISAKRYVLFNRRRGQLIIRKASGHGLGHLMAPFDEPAAERRARIERIGVPLWQESLWREIIRAAETDSPDETRTIDLPRFDGPAASQYAATTPELLKWFTGYNDGRAYEEKVRPFGFMLSLQAKSRLQMSKDEPEALRHALWSKRHPRPAAPYYKLPSEARDHVFDRELGPPIPATWLKSIGRSLVRYHLHEEWKFKGAEYEQCGPLTRRHVQALGRRQIGKEGDDVEESEFIGEDNEPIEYPVIDVSRDRLANFVVASQERFEISDRDLIAEARISAQTLKILKRLNSTSVAGSDRVLGGINKLIGEAKTQRDDQEKWRAAINRIAIELGGRNKLAAVLDLNAPYLGRVMRGERPVTTDVMRRLASLEDESFR